MKRIPGILLLIFLAGALHAQVEASFVTDTNLVKTFTIRCTAGDAGAGVLYFWDFGDTTGDTGRVVRHHYTGAGDYLVTLVVTDPVTASTDTASRIVRIRDFLSAPNVFTPNNDNINDLFIIRSNGQDTYTMTVFTRAGVKVFRTTGRTLVWDGKTPAGVLVSPGVYYYILTGANGFYKKGFVYVYY